jgi:hypothetical protein
MIDKPLKEMSTRELIEEVRGRTVGDFRRIESQAELDLRNAQSNGRFLFWSTIAAAFSAVASMVAAFASLWAIHSK